ncbi:hypothetical protein L249_6780 [Ophiocordyceps polyrhachis-furcata BCC 54312]|uniref:DOMON domain-containing protein n=1 Tax=Ophiocordyceps polyrhachis-furcata BCC 54312 TaxID=1330021 RepID=A0A367LJQ7_9HYPO|nr:hypothetical protein L249_6780 [Ophiocordyceps polyrhachis-furcata BCC 54312]
MRLTNKAAAAVALSATTASAATGPFCPESGVCFRWAVPSNSTTTTSNDVMFQLQAPTSYRWVALGIGSQMRDADMFVVYASGSNNNVTLSTRRGTGHQPPRYTERSDVQLVEGSGISDGIMTANVRCSGCDSLDLGGSSEWIAAWQSGDAINSQSPSAPIAKHDGFNSFSVNMATAAGSTNRAPFFGSDGPSGANPVGRPRGPRLGLAHGVLMSVIFIFGYPVGSLLMPLVGNWLLHGIWQIVTFLGMWAGFGIGYYIAQRRGILYAGPHTTLGTCVCALMCLQPVLGYLHHMYYVKHRTRGPVSYAHIFYGRSLMILGLVNGGLGISLTGSDRTFVIAYSVLAIFFFLLYVGVSVVFSVRKMKQAPAHKPSSVIHYCHYSAWGRDFGAEDVHGADDFSKADFVQELYLKELKAYKVPPVKESDSHGQVQAFTMPKTPASPEETDLASSLKQYESMVVDIQAGRQDLSSDPSSSSSAAAAATPASLPDWLEVDEEDESPRAH